MPKQRRWIDVSVTQEHIDKGNEGDCYRCPVALALRDATGYEWDIWNTQGRIMVQTGRKPIWRFPPEVRDFIADFDNHSCPVPTPFSFRLPARFASDQWRGHGADIEGRRRKLP